ncbi:MAG: DegT/DnrJ/EryC1/StrS family aminotransferase [Saprospiraceae bacterium]|nr:DegT/DnrJ/EryC1/StrS family aminotransferase [Saprospiraceae bacterium]
METIPFLDLHRQYLGIADEVKAGWDKVLEKTAFAGGPFVTEFEHDFAVYCQTNFAAGLNTGTSALHLAMLALGIGPGDEVILPGNTFIATAWGISYCGAIPVFVDCDEYWNIDPEAVEAAITTRTKAIAAVHLYGQPCKLDVLKAIAQKNHIYLIEDAAQAHGARYLGKRVGGHGDIAAFSFYPGKNLGAYGEGGGVTTDDKSLIDHIYRLRNHGADKRYYHEELGFNMRMDGLQAVVLKVKLQYLDNWNNKRKEIANRYITEISNEHIRLPKVLPESEPVWHLFVVTASERDNLIGHLDKSGIQSALHYPVPCHLQNAYAHLNYHKGQLPKSEYLATHCVSLPMFAELTTQEVDRIIESVNSYKK